MFIQTDKVKQFQQIFDEVATKPNTKDWQLRIKLLQEELDELKEAFEKNDLVEVADAYGDILFLTLGGVYKHGIPSFNNIFDEICDSNLSKADYSLEDVEKSKRRYSENGIDTYIDKKETNFFIKRTEDNKVLKSHKYQAVSLEKYFKFDELNKELLDILYLFRDYINEGLIKGTYENTYSVLDSILYYLIDEEYDSVSGVESMINSTIFRLDDIPLSNKNKYTQEIIDKLRENYDKR